MNEIQELRKRALLYKVLITEEKILEAIAAKHHAVAILFTCVTLDPTKFWERGTTVMQLKSNQQSVATIQAVDAEGNPTTLDTPPTWESDTPGTVTITPSPDGMSAVIGSPTPGPLGSAIITVKAVAGGKDIEATLAVDIIAGDAVALQINTGAPTDVP